jgi:hypothetical protein
MEGCCFRGYEPSGFHKMLGNSWVAVQLAASQEGLSSMQLVITITWIWALQKQPVDQPLKIFSAFCGNRRFIIEFTRARHWSLSWASWVQSTPSPSCLVNILHLHSDLPNKILTFKISYPNILVPFVLHFLYALMEMCIQMFGRKA